ncbi:uncharacterized protein PFL1_04208 [Pseudozyma flocculosa PF-1]|uniref:Uncharacterized protein n=2 Tax=Pseudozyma flocculosa TaxID=84751 RepID=A0A5C3EVJ5_9BASI|nr:uncharacterized protein PFL1_04208 [Pseudozyma flocculosa PF-1]EPQ28381.1 hypothetical protein PFL1_04208 [Pseudozyma flocculosa PF-1]SPO35536.1 uncharacterized protein PSFLO_01007 [Pseudozyma flocculosa]
MTTSIDTRPSEPIRQLADTTPDPVASDDFLRGREESLSNALGRTNNQSGVHTSSNIGTGASASTSSSHNDESDVEDHTAAAADEGGNKSLVGGVSAAAASVGGAVYAGANNVFQKAPDLGLTAAFSRWTGVGAQTGQDDTAGSTRDDADSTSTAGNEQEGSTTATAEAKEGVEEERGPSNPERLDKPQTAVGTEYGIPTSAGAGTTLSPDLTVREAADREKELRGNDQVGGKSAAVVGQDYRDQPCPTADAARAHPTSQPAEGKTDFADQHERERGRTEGEGEGDVDSSLRQSGSGGKDSERTLVDDDADGDDDSETARSKRSLGAKLKDKIKGEAKVIAGKVRKDEDAVLEGRAIKQGVDKTEVRV